MILDTQMTPESSLYITLACIAAYILACAWQMYSIQSGLGLALPFSTVFTSTLKLMFTRGPWIPFLMHPPS